VTVATQLTDPPAATAAPASPAHAAASKKGPRLGDLLIKSGAINQQQLEHALVIQKQLKLPLGKTLVKLNYLNDEALRHALSSQLNIPFVDLDKTIIDRHLAKLVSRSYAKRYNLVPVAQIGRTLTVAMDDPTATTVADELRRLTSFTITVVTATSDAIQRCFAKLYEAEGAAPAGPAANGAASAANRAATMTVVLDEQTSKRADDLLRQILSAAFERRTSDIHVEMLETCLNVRFRIDGVLRKAEFGSGQALIDQNAREIISRIKILAKMDIAERRRPQDGSFQAPADKSGKTNVDLRVSVVPSHYGESVVIRILDRTRAPKSLADLDMAPEITAKIDRLLERTTGIFLVTGPTGSGKSTTLYSCLMKLHSPEIRILTAEDPVEFVYEGLSQSEVNHTIGNTFATYLRAFLRHDPEVIMVGEIRDEETAEMAFRAAQTGHLLLSTLHTNSAIAALPRLRDLKIDPSLIASSLIGVVSQRLARRLCQDCKEDVPGDERLVQEFFGREAPGFPLYRGRGCDACGFTGYKGRMLIADLWAPDQADQVLITRDAAFDEVRASAERTTFTMAQDAAARLRAGRTTLEELLRVLPHTSIAEHRARHEKS
jgi:type IV pilus assembly protein PilB